MDSKVKGAVSLDERMLDAQLVDYVIQTTSGYTKWARKSALLRRAIILLKNECAPDNRILPVTLPNIHTPV